MYSNYEMTVLRELDQFKWSEEFCCGKCLHNEYMPGKKELSRRCKKCKYDESLLKHTAFEGLRMPVSKAYDILSFLVNRSKSIDWTKKVILRKGKAKAHNGEEEVNDVDYVSLEDIYLRYKKRGATDVAIDNRLQVEMQKLTTPAITEIAQRFEVAENSVIKLMERVNNRIMLDVVPGIGTPYERVHNFISHYLEGGFISLISMLMSPLPGEWQWGITDKGEQWFALIYSDDVRNSNVKWHIYPVRFTIRRMIPSENKDVQPFKEFDYHFNPEDKIIYASEQWKMFIQYPREDNNSSNPEA